MKEKHYTRKDLNIKSTYEIANELIELGAPIKLKCLTKIDISSNDIIINGNFESHVTSSGGITYLWGEGDWFE